MKKDHFITKDEKIKIETYIQYCCNSSDKSIVCSAEQSTNYRGHVTPFAISIKSQTTQLVHRYTTDIMHNKTARIYVAIAFCEWWSTACNSSHPVHWQKHYEDGEWWALHKPLILYGAMLSGKRLFDSYCAYNTANMSGSTHHRRQHRPEQAPRILCGWFSHKNDSQPIK